MPLHRFLHLGPLLAFLFFSKAQANEKHLYVLGGGGEPTGTTTMFDRNMENLGSFVAHSDWKSTVTFNGGHSETESLLKSNFKKASRLSSFNAEGFKDSLSDITKKLNEGTLKKDDQLMLIVDTHGVEGGQNGQKSHDIVLSNKVGAQGTQTVSMDRLKPIMELAHQKGVKLAIIDNSCYSGNTHALNDKQTCLISSAGSAHPAFGGGQKIFFFNYSTHFSGKFYDKMKSGKNLEEIYLSARKSSDNPDFPMISTPEGEAAQTELYHLISPFLYFNYKSKNDFDTMYSRKKIEQSSCQSQIDYLKLQKFITEQSTVLKDLKTAPLKKALEDYRNYQIKYEEALKAANKAEAEIKKILQEKYGAQKDLWQDQEAIDFLSADYEKSLAIYKATLKGIPSSDREAQKKMQELVALNEEKIKIRDGLAAQLSPEAHGKLQALQYIVHTDEETFSRANKVGLEAKKLYDELYKNKSEERKRSAALKGENDSNPCRDFKL
jgi:hypothetical protein